MSKKPLLAITMGDPAGVGPETIVRSWGERSLHSLCRRIVLAHPQIMRRAVALIGATQRVVEVSSPEDVDSDPDPDPDCIPCLPSAEDSALEVLPATIDARGGQAAFDCLVQAARLAQEGRVDGITTAPLHKAALALAGHCFPGHTELLAHLCGAKDVAMMLYLPGGPCVRGRVGLGVAHVTLHTALRDVFSQLSSERILATARLADQVMRRFIGSDAQVDPPRLGICALNPHAGEHGLFGDEEQRIIAPAIRRGISHGLQLEGPFPADSLMRRAADGEFDAVVAMYHDQGHIALKLLDMHHAVNITLGLPLIRTSVAHGTAFDLAWLGKANASGMVTALEVAARLVAIRETSKRDRLLENKGTKTVAADEAKSGLYRRFG